MGLEWEAADALCMHDVRAAVSDFENRVKGGVLFWRKMGKCIITSRADSEDALQNHSETP